MKPDAKKATSRPLEVAKRLSKAPLDEATIYGKTVILTGESEALNYENGRWCFMASLSLLTRVVGDLVVVLPQCPGGFESEVRKVVAAAWSRGSIRVSGDGEARPWKQANAVLNVGANAIAGCPCTIVNCNGWVARVSNGVSLPLENHQSNAMAALMAASFGVTEVFKRVFDVSPDIAPLIDRIDFSLFEQSTSFSGLGPELPATIELMDTLLVGGGAIGNGIAWLLTRLPIRGRLHIIDKQNFAEENLGTCILVEVEGWLGHPKAERLTEWLLANSQLAVTGEKALIEEAKSGAIVKDIAIDLVINALDDAEARREAQTLWPRIIVDGGINDVGAAVTQHRLERSGMACLRCWFESKAENEKVSQSRATGLDIQSLADSNRLIEEEDIARADPSKREWLREQKNEGKTICSIISEIALSKKLGVEVSGNFRPSVPFVATAAAAMTMAEAVKAVVFSSQRFNGMVHIANLFVGANKTLISLNMPALATCQCVAHRYLIEQLAEKRSERA
jgi:molybdopterin/thiamine biosynthesis adenylyltransferase